MGGCSTRPGAAEVPEEKEKESMQGYGTNPFAVSGSGGLR
ncbi:MAG: hypothetical protein MZV63_00380 [Marinilabiliales bacterium]|nr:hypothetical protein [Marinilabiliales bacterium]